MALVTGGFGKEREITVTLGLGFRGNGQDRASGSGRSW